jgi:hypothetical protein
MPLKFLGLKNTRVTDLSALAGMPLERVSLPSPPTDLSPLKEGLLQHQTVEGCAGCHRTIDPYGLAMENFNGVGLWRDKEDGERPPNEWGNSAKPIVNEGTLPNGDTYASCKDFKSLLAKQSERFERGLAERLLMYALGRTLGPADDTVVQQLVADMRESGHSLKGLIRGITETRAFQSK